MHESTKVCCYEQRPVQATSMRDLTLASNINPSSNKIIDDTKPAANKKNQGKMKIKKHLGHKAMSPVSAAATADENNNELLDSVNDETTTRHHNLMFKYQTNATRHDLEQMRELLREERRKQLKTNQFSAEELNFLAADYERMMLDDWLVTRFLLRGRKAYERGDVLTSTGEMNNQQNPSAAGVFEHTLELIKVCAKFRFEFRINDRTKLAEFPRAWTKVEGLIHYRPDLVGNPTAYLRVALHRPKLIESPEARHQFKRYLLYLLELCDRELQNRPGKAICCVFDMTNAGFENIDLELTTWMIKSFKNCSPKLLGYVIVYNPPWFFTATFRVICNTLLSTSKRQSVKFACGNEILDYISYDNLPPYLQSAIN